MAILDKLKTQGSTLTKFNGATPSSYNGVSQYEKVLKDSQLDLDGKKPSNNYRDNAPEGQSGRI